MKKGLIYDGQGALFGMRNVIGYCNGKLAVKEISRDVANKTIIENHYSHKIYNATYIHLGVFIDEKFVGVLQYGYAMNPASAGNIVKDTQQDQYLELNRMWLSDEAGRNSESMAISCSLTYIRHKYPKVKWVQSFADERCRCFGIVYQACSFDYYGEHTNIFWELDGVFYHNTNMTISKESQRYKHNVGGGKFLQENKESAIKHTLRQFRYIKFLDMSWKNKCLLKQKPYPKYYE